MHYLERSLSLLGLILMVTAAPANAASALLLDDDFDTEVKAALENAGHTVTSILYYD